MDVNEKVHGDDFLIRRFYPDGKIEYTLRNGVLSCGYCGSMSPIDALRLLKHPFAHGSGSDWKYGWPHKFYIDAAGEGIKFYSRHLYDADEKIFSELTDIIAKKLGIRFEKDEIGLKYSAPYHGFQTWFGVGMEYAPKVPEDM